MAHESNKFYMIKLCVFINLFINFQVLIKYIKLLSEYVKKINTVFLINCPTDIYNKLLN